MMRFKGVLSIFVLLGTPVSMLYASSVKETVEELPSRELLEFLSGWSDEGSEWSHLFDALIMNNKPDVSSIKSTLIKQPKTLPKEEEVSSEK